MAFTASALNGVPSWNLTPGRSLKVQVLKSSEWVQDSASFGCASPLSSSVGQRLENRGGGGLRRGVEHADLQRIEAGNVEFQPDGDAAALLLRQGRTGQHCDADRRTQDRLRKRVRAEFRFHAVLLPMSFHPVIRMPS